MSLVQNILADYQTALKERNDIAVSTLRMLKASIMNAQIAARGTGKELDDAALTNLIRKEAKKRRESASAFRAGGREDLAKKEDTEQAVLTRYLPPMMSEKDVRAVVMKNKMEMGSVPFGSLMGAVMKELAGRADGQMVQRLVKEIAEA